MTNHEPAVDQEFTIVRDFHAPRELVWKAYTDLEHLKQWWGPTGFTFLSSTLDLKPGGSFHFGMAAPDGTEMWARFIYREIIAPEKLVYITTFSNQAGEFMRPPFEDNWPWEILNTVVFTDCPGGTTLTMHSVPVNATEEERAIFHSNYDSMEQGYGGTFDQLDTHLRTLLA